MPPLYAAGIAENPCAPHDVIVVPAGSRQHYFASSSVLETTPATACQQAAVRADRQWLSSGIVPGDSPLLTSLATRALLDLRLSTRPDGAVIAGWHNRWEYSWPRDSSWAAVALALPATPAIRCAFSASCSRPSCRRAPGPRATGPTARVRSTTGVRPNSTRTGGFRGRCGAGVSQESHESESAEPQLAGLWPMVEAAADATVRSLAPDGLPAASMDYWENSVQVTLSTAAALLTGLRAAADIAGELGHENVGRAVGPGGHQAGGWHRGGFRPPRLPPPPVRRFG